MRILGAASTTAISLLEILLLARSAAAFSFNPSHGMSSSRTVVNIDEEARRDVYAMESWAVNCGVQKADGFEIVSTFQDGQEDYYAKTQQNIPSGSPVLFVPNEMIFSSSKASQEFNGALQTAESQLSQANLAETIPLFRIFCKVLAEYEKGEESPWYTWLDSLPRRYNNGASMTFGTTK